jgi:ubiquinone/menaquinone biosynthesis C-methylase UbiE
LATEDDTAARASAVVREALAALADRSRAAYTADLAEFGRFIGHEPSSAIAALVAAGWYDAGRMVLRYAVRLRKRGLAPTTVRRRLATLSALMMREHDAGLVDWVLDVPGDDRIAAAMRTTAAEAGTYMFPNHPGEIDRLDIQHYALRLTLGSNYLAPIHRPTTILDSGSGTGQWAYEVGAEFPDALIVGFDLQSTKPGPPPNFRFVNGNLLQGLPFADGQFDFVHQRLLIPAVPLRSWAALLDELVRVARPGAWVELVEAAWDIEPAGPATARLLGLARRLAVSLGLDSTGSVYRSLAESLARAGLASVRRRTLDVPLGEWGGRVGSLMATDYRAAATRLSDLYESRFGVPAAECRALIRRAGQEWDQLRSTCAFAIAVGRKTAISA